jgi:MFS family permease
VTGENAAEGNAGGGPSWPAGRAARPGSLRRHGDFNKLWLGQAISDVGSQVTVLALPLTAVIYLNATATQVGLMTSATQLAFLGPTLFFGVMVDRMRKRQVMIGADLGRAVVLGLIPILAWTGSLSMPVMYAVAFVHGCLTVMFDLSYRSYLPSLIGADLLLAGNSRLQSTESVAQVGGPGLGGLLVQLLRAPFALLADAASFLFSAGSVISIRAPEPAPALRPVGSGSAGWAGVLSDIRSGLRFIAGHPVLRSLAGAGAAFNFFSQLQLTVIVLYTAHDKHMSAGQIGLLFAGFGVGGVLAATVLGRALRWLGYGRLLLLAYTVAAAGLIGLPFVPGSAAVSTALFAGLYVVAGSGIVALNIVSLTLRQVATPGALQARVNASFRVAISGLMPVSAIVAGLLGDRVGLRATLFIAAGGMPLVVGWIALSPARRVKTLAGLGAAEPGAGQPAVDAETGAAAVRSAGEPAGVAERGQAAAD